ncbi:MAG TPA: hypothetical protein VMY39_03985 [Planctomycetota bacterium]|nr:hypothetical protein [Planctomycetota bacterium]
MLRRLLIASLIAVLAGVCGCQTDGTPADETDVYARPTSDYTYDKFGFQVDARTGERIDSAYNRRLEKQIGR